MTVALSSLRVVTEGDSSSYVKSMNDVASSSDKATESVGKTGDALTNASSRFERLQRSLDPAYASHVRLTQAQTTLQGALDRGVITVDRYNELMALAGKRFEDAGHKAGPLKEIFSGISAQLIALSEGAGPVGVALAAFGPIGLAAAVGFGAATEAVRYLREEAGKFGENAAKLRDFAETAGATAVQMQVLQRAGAAVGLSSDQMQTSFERFSVQLSELQKGTGNFFTELRKVSPELALQMARTRDAAAAWDILAKAYAEADVRQQALLAHAAFGRGGAGSGRLLTATEEAGGIAGLQAKLSPAELFDDSTVQRVANLKVALDEANKSTKEMFASMYAEEVLQNQLKFALKQKEITETIKESGTWWQRLLETMAMAQENPSFGQPNPPTSMDLARSRLTTGLLSNQLTGNNGQSWLRNVYRPPSYDQEHGPSAGLGPEFQINVEKARIEALGSAATASEKLALKLKELKFEQDQGVLSTTDYGRAVAAVKLDNLIALEGQRIALLGELAPVTEIVRQREDLVFAARKKGVTITDDEARSIRFLTQTQTEGARIQEKITAGVASETEIYDQLGKQLQVLIDKKLLDPTSALQMANAQVVLGKSFQKMSDEAQLARAPLEQLKRWQLDNSKPLVQIDAASVSVLNQMTTSIVDFTTGAKTATQAFQDFGKSTIKILEELIVRMLLARSLGLLGLGGSTAPPVSNPYSGMLAGSNPTFHGGGMMDEPSGYRYVNPAVFFNAPRAHSGIGPDEMPVITRRDEMILTGGQLQAVMRAGAAMGGGSKTQVNVYNQAEGTTAKTSTRRSGGVEITDVIISTVNNAIAQGRMDGPLRARTGTQLQPRGR